MFSDPVSFNGDTRVEVIAVLANCGRDTDRARRALVTWIQHKQSKGRSTEHILTKLRDIESKFIKDATLHSAFRDARAETYLPRAPDLPLPFHIRRQSAAEPESVPSVITPRSTGRGSISSSIVELPLSLTQYPSPPTPASSLSRDSSQIADILSESRAGQRLSLPQCVAQFHSPRIHIPRDRSIQPGPSSPITSSPDESEIHLSLRYMPYPVGPSSQSTGLVTPVSGSPPEFPLSPVSAYEQPRRRSSHGHTRSAWIPISDHQSRRSVPLSPPTSSSDESDFRLRRYRPVSQPVTSISPGRRRVTPPRTYPPDVPLPPIPSDDQLEGAESDGDSDKIPRPELPPTPVRSLTIIPSTPLRPLPIQPIPSPVPGSDESEHADIIGENTLQQNCWHESSTDLPSDIVVRTDSPVYVFHNDAISAGISPPPYADRLDAYSPPDMLTIGPSLERAVSEHGGSQEVQLVISKCIEFRRGFEPPYWQARLQACGLDVESAKHLVDEMCKQVDWAASLRRQHM